MSDRFDRLLLDCRAASMRPGDGPYGVIEDCAVAIACGRIAWIGPRDHLPQGAQAAAKVVDRLDGRWITPGLIDCHTHLVFGGDRSDEFAMRLGGASYEEIAQAGGGILSTVERTRASSEDELLASAMTRLDGLKRDGVTTVEIKSGYGLDKDTEMKMLRVARRLSSIAGVRVRTSFLGMHAVPSEFRHNRNAYVDLVVDGILPEAARAGLVDMVDAYCEPIAFSAQEIGRLFDRAEHLGLPVKLHADQLSDSGGALLAAARKALSADHLEHASEAGIAAMGQAGVVAVLLPGAYLMLRDTTLPAVDCMRHCGVGIAVATDCNPGTSPVASLQAAMTLACAQFRLTPQEALDGVTRHAAKALGLEEEVGMLEIGKAADIGVWNINGPAELSYWLGKPLLERAYFAGAPRA